MSPTPPASARPAGAARVTLDRVAASAVGLARDAAVEVAEPGTVGEHLGATAEGERLVTHAFACTQPGYRGWHWSVTLARVPRARSATVCDVALLPGDDAVVAPAWLPWDRRVRPGDLGPAHVLPRVADDPRLDLGFEATGDEDADRVAIVELGLGRARVLSAEGRADAADRWVEGEHGPRSPHAEAAASPCATCGFLVRMAGSMRTAFGVCANEWSPADGAVVSLAFGCGAHSETDIDRDEGPAPQPLVDELLLETVPTADLPASAPAEDTQVDVEVPVDADEGPDADA